MKKLLTLTVIISFIAAAGFVAFEPSIIQAASSSDNVNVVSLTVASEISATCSDVGLLPNIDLTNDGAAGTSTCTIETNADGGYILDVSATSSNALTSGLNYFTDYGTSSEPYAWSVGASDILFGFSMYGTDVSTGIWGNYTGGCGVGGTDFTAQTNALYQGFDTTATTAIGATGGPTAQGGTNSYICIVAEQGNSVNADSGSYNAVVMVTATTQ